jgi:hypothetical protein
MANMDSEEITVAWLKTFAGDWSVSGNKPKETPDKYITVDRAGGPRVAMVLDAGQILIEVYHKESRKTAKDKANEIADRIVELKAYDENITVAEINSVVHVPDLITGYECYQVYCDISHRR